MPEHELARVCEQIAAVVWCAGRSTCSMYKLGKFGQAPVYVGEFATDIYIYIYNLQVRVCMTVRTRRSEQSLGW